MPIEKFIKHLKTLGKIDNTDIEKINDYFKIYDCKKYEILISKDSVCNKLFFVVKGILRADYDSDKGIEVTRRIAFENQFCTNISSFQNLSHNNEYIQSLENTTVLWIHHYDFYKLLAESDNAKTVYIKILEDFQTYSIKKIEFLETIGYHTQRAASGSGLSIVVGSYGATYGASIGVWFGGVGAVPGAIIGGLIGGIGGGMFGQTAGEVIIDEVHK